MSAPEPIVMEVKLTQSERELLLFALGTLRYEYRHAVGLEEGLRIISRVDAMRDRLKKD